LTSAHNFDKFVFNKTGKDPFVTSIFSEHGAEVKAVTLTTGRMELHMVEEMEDVRASMPFYIDPTVEHVGISKLRQMNATSLSDRKKMLVIQDNNTPLAVLLNYEEYLIMQGKFKRALETIRMLKSSSAGVMEGLQDMKAGKLTPLEEVDPTLK
jgi:hypothetical protein